MLNISILKIKENKKTIKKPIIILRDEIWIGSNAIIAYFIDKNELPQTTPRIESKIQDIGFWFIFLKNIFRIFKLI